MPQDAPHPVSRAKTLALSSVHVKLAVKAERWAVLKASYERLRTWLATIAPQLEAAGPLLRRLARQTTENPNETLLQPASG